MALLFSSGSIIYDRLTKVKCNREELAIMLETGTKKLFQMLDFLLVPKFVIF